MSRLVAEVSQYIRSRMQHVVGTLQGSDGALRSVFHGPPLPYLEPVLRELEARGGLEVTMPDGSQATIPVLLPEDRRGAQAPNPTVGLSGTCDHSYLLALRNTPACPRFLALAAPAPQSILSIAQATDEFGLSADNNGGNASIDDWWGDGFVQRLVDAALGRSNWASDLERIGARRLLEQAVKAADEADRHGVQRLHAWATLSRVLSIADSSTPFRTQWSMACGFPAMDGDSIDADEQSRVLAELAAALVDDGFALTSERLKRNATEAEATAIDECLDHLQRRCEVPLALMRAAPYYYAPHHGATAGQTPSWWARLTANRLAEMLEREVAPSGAIAIDCGNPHIPPVRGMPVIVRDAVRLSLSLPEAIGAADVTVTREAGSQANKHEWRMFVGGETQEVVDSVIPRHQQPVRYSASAGGLKKATIRIVSLSSWEPGIVVSSRGATKATLPKKARAASGCDYECQLTMAGEGRHLLDLYLSPGVSATERVTGKDNSRADIADLEAVISVAPEGSDGPAGLEVVVSADCYYDVAFTLGDGSKRILRVSLTGDETPSEGCRSEFERLIRLNGVLDRGRAAAEVQLDRQVRTADLQSWMLDAGAARRSFHPIVLAPDCRDAWRAPDWNAPTGTIFSRGRFLHDPRPPVEDLRPPIEFVDAREKIATKIRGEDEHGLVEIAQFGRWMRDPEFVACVDDYVRAYLRWLDADPDAAAWTDLALVCGLEPDGRTLSQEPDAVLVSPLHPIRIGWHSLAQHALLEAWHQKMPCPAGSILDPDCLPDILALPLRSASGGTKRVVYLATECSSDYWAILWNGGKLDQLMSRRDLAPFDPEFGIQLGGVSSGFSVSQVRRSLDDVSGMLAAKPTLNVVVSSSAGQSNACTEGLMSWAREHFREQESGAPLAYPAGTRLLQVFDERRPEARPEDAAVANLTEDTDGAVRWFNVVPSGAQPDLGIIAQLETSNPSCDPSDLASPLGIGALMRHRVRTQLRAGDGAFLSESRMAMASVPSGNGLADNVMQAVARLENLGDSRFGYTFAPSVQAIQSLFERKQAEYVAVSSSAIDPACFLGGWLQGVYLWDYELPSYSHRAGDTNGYYLLTRIKSVDTDSVSELLAKLPGCGELEADQVHDILIEVARRGMPTVRGLSAGHSGAAGDLGLFMAGRLLQDEFRVIPADQSIVPVLTTRDGGHEIALVIPVDPFRGYLQDLQRTLGVGSFQRPDLLVAGISVTDSTVTCRLTPIEVKYRQGQEMTLTGGREALGQARALSDLLTRMQDRAANSGLVMWQLAFQHLLASMLDFGFRVYSQQVVASQHPAEWSVLHNRVLASLLAGESKVEVDPDGRLVLFDASASSGPRDLDNDGFDETIALRASDAASIVKGTTGELYDAIRNRVHDWRLQPSFPSAVSPSPQQDRAGDPSRAQPQVPQPSGEPAQQPARLASETVPGSVHGGNPSARDAGPAVVDPQVLKGADERTPVRDVDEPLAQGQAATTSSSGISALVGITVDDFNPGAVYLRPSLTALNQLNMGVVGDLGTGKTQLVKSLVYQITRQSGANDGVKPRFLIFDYKKDYSAPDFVKAVGAKVVAPHRIPLNLFDISGSPESSVPWMNRYKFFADVLDKIYSNVGPVQRENLKRAVKDSYSSAQAMGRQPTIHDVYDRYRLQVQDKADAPLAIISDMLDLELFVEDASAAVPFEKFFDGVVVVSLDQLGQDDRSKNTLVALMLNMFYEYMLRIPKRPYRGTNPQLRTVDSYLLVDEADNIMRYEFDVLRKVLLQGREFGVGVVLASQYLKHFKAGATDYREPLLSWFIHKVPNVTPQELAALGLTATAAQAADRIRTLQNHQLLYKSFDVGGTVLRGIPFYEAVTMSEL